MLLVCFWDDAVLFSTTVAPYNSVHCPAYVVEASGANKSQDALKKTQNKISWLCNLGCVWFDFWLWLLPP
jgi:hypothetical protein